MSDPTHSDIDFKKDFDLDCPKLITSYLLITKFQGLRRGFFHWLEDALEAQPKV